MSQNVDRPLLIRDLKKSYGPVEALKGVSFAVEPGEVFGLLGPNGAGKTSLISIIVTLEKMSGGEVRVFGDDVTLERPTTKCRIGWVPQEVINHGYFSTFEILEFQAGYYGVRNPKARIEELLRELDLYEHRHKKVRQLSGGMKRRLMIAKALVHEPQLLLLDEPTAGVDVELRQKLWEFVKTQRSKGLSILLTTHYLEEAEILCDRVAIINKGELKAIDKTHELISQFSRKMVRIRLDKPRASMQHKDLWRGGGEEWFFMVDMKKSIGELLAEIKVETRELCDIDVRDGSLEDVFVHFTKGPAT